MSVELITEFLDKHSGHFYTVKDLNTIFKNKISIRTIDKNLKRIIKREEYEAIWIKYNTQVKSHRINSTGLIIKNVNRFGLHYGRHGGKKNG